MNECHHSSILFLPSLANCTGRCCPSRVFRFIRLFRRRHIINASASASAPASYLQLHVGQVNPDLSLEELGESASISEVNPLALTTTLLLVLRLAQHNPVETLWARDWGREPDLLVRWLLVNNVRADWWENEGQNASLFASVSSVVRFERDLLCRMDSRCTRRQRPRGPPEAPPR